LWVTRRAATASGSARAIGQHGIEVYVMHPASLAVERRGRCPKTDRQDRPHRGGHSSRGHFSAGSGENRATAQWRPFRARRRRTCASQWRRREALTAARLKIANQMRSLLVRFGVADFRARLKKAPGHLGKAAHGRRTAAAAQHESEPRSPHGATSAPVRATKGDRDGARAASSPSPIPTASSA
jgi:transposase